LRGDRRDHRAPDGDGQEPDQPRPDEAAGPAQGGLHPERQLSALARAPRGPNAPALLGPRVDRPAAPSAGRFLFRAAALTHAPYAALAWGSGAALPSPPACSGP